jgi:hypothetical protein
MRMKGLEAGVLLKPMVRAGACSFRKPCASSTYRFALAQHRG